LQIINEGLVHSASDVCDGGIAATIARATFANGIGATIDLSDIDKTHLRTPISHKSIPASVVLFAEYASQVLITCDPADADAIGERFGLVGVRVGETTAEGLQIKYDDATIQGSLEEFSGYWSSSLESQLTSEVLA
jgi:phosphoribosylformylglycinamidine synthase